MAQPADISGMGSDSLQGCHRISAQFHCVPHFPVKIPMVGIRAKDKGEAGTDDAGSIFPYAWAVAPDFFCIARGQECLAAGIQENAGGQIHHTVRSSQPFHVLFRGHIHMLNHLSPSVNTVFKTLSANTVCGHRDSQPRPLADGHGYFLQA